jgi:hypothetical protein
MLPHVTSTLVPIGRRAIRSRVVRFDILFHHSGHRHLPFDILLAVETSILTRVSIKTMRPVGSVGPISGLPGVVRRHGKVEGVVVNSIQTSFLSERMMDLIEAPVAFDRGAELRGRALDFLLKKRPIPFYPQLG